MNFKSILLSSVLFIALGSCNNSASNTSEAGAVDSLSTENLGSIEFVEDSFDFGTVKEGAVVEHVFTFKNSGESPVILSQVTASCGCTTPNYTTDPVLPGKEGEIKVSFNSQGQVGQVQKIVSVASNAKNNVTTVKIEGTVEK